LWPYWLSWGVPSTDQKKPPLCEKDLSRWKLVADFQARLGAAGGADLQGTFADPRRLLGSGDYLGLLLFGLFNPVVDSMRGICAATKLKRVQEEVCARPVSLGSFSEAQAVVDPRLLHEVFLQLAAEQQPLQGDPRLARYGDKLLAIDGTVWAALPRMTWALWRWQHGRESAVKAHVQFNLLQEKPVAVAVTTAKRCERAVLRAHWQSGAFYVGDRNYGQDYGFFAELEAAGCSYLVRLRAHAVFAVQEEFALSFKDRADGVTFDGLVHLGERGKGPLIRLVRVQTEKGEMLLVTNQPHQELCAELVALIYRYRWRIELFFKWVKCILGCRHWLAESPRGVALQIYCALIAALLLLRHTGRRPNKRAMEMIQFYLAGSATLDELTQILGIEKKSP
jgi:hypothetical protein